MKIRKNGGFTLIELIVTMLIFVFAIAAASDMFIVLLRQFKKQSKISESNIEGVVGLELLRLDIERAGFGLPWVIPSSVPAYNEASGTYAAYNDCSGVSPCNPPRPILSDNNYGADLPDYGMTITTTNGFNYADLLVIKANNIDGGDRSSLWTYLTQAGMKQWTPTSENLQNGDFVTVLSPGTTDSDVRTLVNYGSLYQNVPNPAINDPAPQFVYGLASSDISAYAYKHPYNRADYYITTKNVPLPARCASNTGVLVKSVISQKDGTRSNITPLLDCVADMKVIYRMDTNADGTIDLVTDSLVFNGQPMTAQQIRAMVKEVRLYILAQIGQKDTSVGLPVNSIMYIGDGNAAMDNGLGHRLNLGTNVNYRWKLYTLIAQPKNMRQN